MNANRHPPILIISGFDPSDGAGLVVDIETAHALDRLFDTTTPEMRNSNQKGRDQRLREEYFR